MSTRYLISIKYTSHFFGCMSLGFIARGYGLAAPFARLSRANLLALLADLFETCLLGFVWGVVAGSEQPSMLLAC